MNNIAFERQQAAYYHDKFPNRTSRSIGKELGHSNVWVLKWWNKNPCNSEVFKDGRKGRKMKSKAKITPRMKQIIKRNMHGINKVRGNYSRKLSQRKMVKKLNDKYDFNVTRKVVQTVLKELKLKYVNRQCKIRLKQDHMKRRLKFAQVIFFQFYLRYLVFDWFRSIKI
jgi:hypothetical protein